MSPPSPRTRVLILGGGPAGSTTASLLARDGIEVTLIEREVFPRYHIGESLLPSCLEIADLIGARELLEKEGFQRKPGAYLEWGRENWSLDFGETIASSSLLTKICGPATLVSEVMLETDYSYAAETFCGPGFFLYGDAACFLDLLLATGVRLALLSTLLGNLRMRQVKVALAQAGAEQRELQEKNVDFFDHVEGLGALDVAVDGLYVTVQPQLGLNHTRAGVRQAAAS